jgi:hypothetical protein
VLTVECFLKRIKQPNSPSWLAVGVDTQDDSNLYIAVNGGMNNINSAPIESYASEIKVCALNMIENGELYIAQNSQPYPVSNGCNVYFYCFQTTKKIESDLTL